VALLQILAQAAHHFRTEKFIRDGIALSHHLIDQLVEQQRMRGRDHSVAFCVYTNAKPLRCREKACEIRAPGHFVHAALHNFWPLKKWWLRRLRAPLFSGEIG